MELRIASGSMMVRGFGGREREFPLLTPRDLGDLQERAPGNDSRYVTIFDLHQWAQTPTGAEHVIVASLRKVDSDLDALAKRDVHAAIAKVRIGSLLQRVELARAIMGASLTNGEEDDGTDSPKAKPRETGSGKPS